MVKVIKTGFYTTIQDLGRIGFQEFGVPVSGVMDVYSAKIANALLGNDKNNAVLEITMTGPTLHFNYDTYICVSGADMSPTINDKIIKLNSVVTIQKEDVLTFGKLKYGFRCYLAVSGGFQSQIVMNSRSQFKEITTQYTLNINDKLSIIEPINCITNSHASIKIHTEHFSSTELKVFKGPEFDLLSKKQQNQLLKKGFTVSKNNNRMAYQLVEPLKNKLTPIITSLVLPGTVQLTPSGALIILMRDCQTTGGYPRVLQLSESAINILSQKFTGKTIQFRFLFK